MRKKSVKDLIQLTIIIKEIKMIAGDSQKINLKHPIVNKIRMIRVNNENVRIVQNLMFHLMIGVMSILVIRPNNYQKKRKVITEVKTLINKIIKSKMIGKKIHQFKMTEIINGMNIRIKIRNSLIQREMMGIINGETNMTKII